MSEVEDNIKLSGGSQSLQGVVALHWLFLVIL